MLAMNVVILDGSRDAQDGGILGRLAGALADLGHKTEILTLREKQIAPCLGCFGCWVKTPGECVVDDAGRDVARAIARCELLAYFTPVTFGGVSSELKKALDRMIPNISPFFARVSGETHHRTRYARPPRLLALGTLPAPDRAAEAVFKTLVERNALNLRSAHTAAAVVVRGAGDTDRVIRELVEVVAR
jgi:hypothetical protein